MKATPVCLLSKQPALPLNFWSPFPTRNAHCIYHTGEKHVQCPRARPLLQEEHRGQSEGCRTGGAGKLPGEDQGPAQARSPDQLHLSPPGQGAFLSSPICDAKALPAIFPVSSSHPDPRSALTGTDHHINAVKMSSSHLGDRPDCLTPRCQPRFLSYRALASQFYALCLSVKKTSYSRRLHVQKRTSRFFRSLSHCLTAMPKEKEFNTPRSDAESTCARNSTWSDTCACQLL